MTDTRKLDAYRRRLEKIQTAAGLTSECIGAVAEVGAGGPGEGSVKGTLVSYTHRLGAGLFGPRLMTDVTLCPECAHRKGECDPANEVTVEDAVLLEIVRNGDREPS